MRRFLSWICLLLFSYSTGTLLNVFIRKDLIINVIFSRSTLYYSIFILFSILLLFLFGYRVNGEKEVIEENDLEDSNFLSKKKVKRLKEFSLFKLSNVHEEEDGFIIEAKKSGKDIDIISCKDLHMLLVGTTGVGKTTGLVDQTIAILSMTKSSPSLVITDPKKELYLRHYSSLKRRGYKVLVIDLREPYKSLRWNPFNRAIEKIRYLKRLRDNIEQRGGKYYLDNEVFYKSSDVDIRKQKIKDEILENIRDIIVEMCPIKNRDQPNWEEGARNLIISLCYAFYEDVLSGRMDEDKFTLFNLFHNLSQYGKEDTKVLKNYLIDSRDKFSKVSPLAKGVLITQDKTLTSYLSEVNSYMMGISDGGIHSLTSKNEINVSLLGKEKTAIFIVVPDERKSRHNFVTMFITELYKELVEMANIGKNGRLERNVYFILDEFGNLPKFQDIESMVTVSRSRGIRFLFILQSFSQLVDKYGREKGDIIKNNCNIKMFLGSDDYETRKEFSELCGNRKIKSLSISSSKDNVSSQIGAQNKPLISPSELERINGERKGEGVVSVRGFYPLFTSLTPSYLLQKYYFTGEEKEEEIEGRCFNEKNSLYDIGELVNNGKEDKEIKEEEKYEEITEDEDIEEIEDDKFSRDLMISGLIDTLIYRVNKYDKDLLTSIPINELPIILRTIAPSYPKYSEEFSRLIKLIEEGK